MAYIKAYDVTIVTAFRATVAKFPNRVMYVNASIGTEWTYSKMETYSNRVANYFLSRGYAKGDSVALFMENRPEYVGLWMGLAKIGVIPALINYNLQQDSLLHTINVAECRAIIYGLELEEAVQEVKESLRQSTSSGKEGFEFFHSRSGTSIVGLATGSGSGFKDAIDLDEALQKDSNPNPEPKWIRESIHCIDNLLYIYTSGTTGLPKAVIIKHVRQLFAMYASHYIIGLSPDDVVYCHLPLYHSSGGQVATCSSILFGTKTVIRRKFSASAFWKDCVGFNITATQYIGECCRYLLATAPVPEERQHKVRIMFGNGLRPQIWTKFVQRFNIPRIAEFYGSTEGKSNICNIENQVGAVGFINVLFPEFIIDKLLPLKLIKVDEATGEPLRDESGFCIQCPPNEPGEFIGKVVRGDPVKDFQGYRDPEATKKKVLENVFGQGDLYFRSGDILVMDELGWLYFKDRSGDTFRWRGENVSTTEVEATVSNILELKDACAYGVEIPGVEGKAGMVAIRDPDNTLDLTKFYRGVSARLPPYARPIFVRCVEQLDLTGTYKLRKRTLQAEAFSIRHVKDPIFFLDNKLGQYVPLTIQLHDDIVKGMVRL
jgi:solute carrier family 27 fatty acid transporter 1/4